MRFRVANNDRPIYSTTRANALDALLQAALCQRLSYPKKHDNTYPIANALQYWLMQS